ncbi:LacI family transcriptional regulator [Palleronia sediminis]|uniref:LacI family transcriptional regulator n=1 Tax=Palleronia sediminis TaxID=2547833 RepID=A0A4R6A5Y6_9RHOB|nr:LacI family DNA-binding transcriptional regulator [Palleronia sediminis]TDL78275.1 LacI family transcriptional regulator [Palleronia sediminis]
MAKARHSLKDVARRAEVSAATVSRFLNGSLDLPETTRTRIERAVRDLDYHPNPHARRLSLGRSDTIALVIPDIANPFFARLAAAMESHAAQHGKMMTLQATMNRSDRELAALEIAATNLVDGLVFMTNHMPPPEVAQRINRFSRAVLVDEDVRGARMPRLLCDNEMGGFLAGDLLYRNGHRRIAYIGGRADLLSTGARLNGLSRGMMGIAPVRSYGDDHATASGRDLARRFLDERQDETAIFVGSDELTIGVLEVFRARDIRIPDEISIVSFDDVRSLHLMTPAITAVAQPVETIGRRAVEILLKGDWDDSAFGTTTELLPVTLTERGSVRFIGQ